MSKAVKGVGRAVKKVVKGVVKVAKKVMKSPIGRIVAMAALSFVGMPMLAGAMQGAAAGSGFLGTISGALSGAAQGFSAAMGGIGTAVSTAASQGLGAGFNSLMSGASTNFGMGSVLDAGKNLVGSIGMGGDAALAAAENGIMGSTVGAGGGLVGEAGSTMGSAIGGTAADTGGLVSGTMKSAIPAQTTITGNPLLTGGGIAPGLPTTVAGEALKQTASGGGILDSIMGGIKEYKLGPSLVQAGGQMLTGAFQGKTLEDQRRYEEERRKQELQRMYDSYKINWRVGDDGRFYAA